MDKYDRHLQFLITAFPDIPEEVCREAFLVVAKRDLRKALLFLLQPEDDINVLLDNFAESSNTEKQIELLNKIFHCYCPNTSYTKIVKNLSSGKPFNIDTATLPKLKKFRRAPRKEVLQKMFQIIAGADAAVLIPFLKGLQSFGRETELMWAKIDSYANHANIEVVRAALDLLAKMPTGVHKSINTFSVHCSNPRMCFYALLSMQNTIGLSSKLLVDMLNPVITAYRKLAMTKGPKNDLWEEFRLVQRIFKNNGVVLSIPDVNLGRF
jgi:hypothetical protein